MAGLSCSNAAAVIFGFNLLCSEANAVGRGGQRWFAGSQRGVMRWGNRAVNAPVLAAVAGGDDRGEGGSYLSMWKRAQEREEALRKRREEQFARLLEVPQEEHDRVQRLEVVDRAAAAEALLAAKPWSSFSTSKLSSSQNGSPKRSAEKPSSNKNAPQIGSSSAAELNKNINTVVRAFKNSLMLSSLYYRFYSSTASRVSKSMEKRRRVRKRVISLHKQRQLAWENKVGRLAQQAWSRAYAKALSALKSSPQAKNALDEASELKMKSELDMHFSS